MIPYILHVTIIIAVCFIFYKLLLQKETFFRLNRWTLLLCLLISFGLPLLPIPQQWSWRNYEPIAMNFLPVAAEKQIMPVPPKQTMEGPSSPSYDRKNNPAPASATKIPDPVIQKHDPITESGLPVSVSNTIIKTKIPSSRTTPVISLNTESSIIPKVLQWLYYLYIFGVVIFGVNLIFQLVILLLQAYGRPVIRDGRFRIVETTGEQAPCSFGNNIFINPAKYDWDTYNQIIRHEKIHISQGHTFDILAAEIVLALQWFNPFAWLYRKEVENNLEFLTDQSLLQEGGMEKTSYQMNLLKVSAPHLPLGITTNYNQSLLKRRIVMMNSKKSSVHTIWKYFFLLPLLTCLVCALNKPAAFGQQNVSGSSQDGQNSRHGRGTRSGDGNRVGRNEGSWYATTKADQLCFELKEDKEEHSWMSSTCIEKSEFVSLPTMGKCEFKLVREAGTLVFTGQFDGEQGYGHYSFKADETYFNDMSGKGIGNLENNDRFAFFLVNIKREYLAMLQSNGFPHLSKNNLIAMAAMGINQPYIHSWQEMGYGDISENDIIAAKAMNLDSAYIDDLRRAGYQHLEIQKLIAFKAQGIDGKYVRGISRSRKTATAAEAGTPSPAPVVAVAPVPSISTSTGVTISTDASSSASGTSYGVKTGVSTDTWIHTDGSELPSADDIIAYKALQIDSAYLQSLRKAGYPDITFGDLTAMKSLNINVEFIKSFEALGYRDIPVHSLIALKSLNITPAYVKKFHELGFKEVPIEQLPALKSLDITAEYIRSFRDIGYQDIDLNELPALKSLGISPQYILEFRKIGYKNIPLNQLPALKSMGITPGYVMKMKEKGFVSNDLNKYIQLKSAFDK